jgi:Flp pilus assembly protein TadB
MPALGVAALYVADRSGFDLLVRSPLGWLALLLSAGMAALGHVLIMRISAVDP